MKKTLSIVPLSFSYSFSIPPTPLSLSATREIRALGYKAPVLGVTGNSLPTDVEHFKSHGANVVLIKPLDFDVFKNAMAGGLLIVNERLYCCVVGSLMYL
jgi:hypothetical protein